MKLFKLDLLTLLISLFILSGCEPSDEVGLAIDPSNAINAKADSSIIVKTATVLEDAVIPNLLNKYPLGYSKDPIFGITDAKVAMSLNLPSSNLTFGTGVILDSAVLVLNYAKEFYGDSTTIFDFKVYQLKDRLIQGTDVLNNVKRDSLPTVIGSKASIINIKDSVKVNQIVKGGVDIQKNQSPQLRIPISASFINDNFLNAASTNFKDNNTFNNFIKGLYVTAKPQGLKAGGIVLLDLSSKEGSKLELYYRNTSGTTLDTILTSFSIQNSIAPVSATFKHSYKGTVVETQIGKPELENNVTYIQPLAGLRTQVNFSNLNTLKSLGNIVINKAELVFSVANYNPADSFKPAPRLFLYTTDIAGQRKVLPDVDDTDTRALPDIGFGGFYNSVKKNYTFTLTAYLQDLLSDKLKPYNLYINSADPTAIGRTAMDPFYTTTGRVVIGNMKLKIIYTKVN